MRKKPEECVVFTGWCGAVLNVNRRNEFHRLHQCTWLYFEFENKHCRIDEKASRNITQKKERLIYFASGKKNRKILVHR
jgi:hypothetical protein